MNSQERLANWKIHESQRGYFSRSLYEEMAQDDNIRIISADLGYGVFDAHREDFGDRFINVGASEQAALGIAVGLAQEGIKPFVYTITSFYLRPAEWLYTYLHSEQTPVRLVGSGLFSDYSHDGLTHRGDVAQQFIESLDIKTYYPRDKEDVPLMLRAMLDNNEPSFIGLRK